MSTIAEARRQAYINRVASENKTLKEQNAALKEALRRTADEENPAQPVPEPGEQGAAASTEEARAADTTTEVTTPGGVATVDPAQNATVTDPGGVAPVEQATQQDVTAPVSGNQQPVADMVTLITPDARGETIGENAMQEGWTAAASRRVFSSIRLARLRIQAGLAEGDDDLSLGQAIAASKMSEEAMRAEINALDGVRRQATQRPGRPVSRTPRLASNSMPVLGRRPSTVPDEDEFAFI